VTRPGMSIRTASGPGPVFGRYRAGRQAGAGSCPGREGRGVRLMRCELSRCAASATEVATSGGLTATAGGRSRPPLVGTHALGGDHRAQADRAVPDHQHRIPAADAPRPLASRGLGANGYTASPVPDARLPGAAGGRSRRRAAPVTRRGPCGCGALGRRGNRPAGSLATSTVTFRAIAGSVRTTCKTPRRRQDDQMRRIGQATRDSARIDAKRAKT
jgi:hypothetical protein